MCPNVNGFIEKSPLDLYGDETSYYFAGFSESGSGINGSVHSKPGLSKG